MIEELDDVLDRRSRKTGRKALVVRSAKRSGFIAGADVNEFAARGRRAKSRRRSAARIDVIDRLENLQIPTVAVIHGFCLGGGFEIALACK